MLGVAEWLVNPRPPIYELLPYMLCICGAGDGGSSLQKLNLCSNQCIQ